MLRFEHAIDKTLARLEDRWRMLTPDMDWSQYDGDDVESLASNSLPPIRRIHLAGGGGRESERLKRKVLSLERENQSLRQDLHRAIELLEQQGISGETFASSEEKKEAINWFFGVQYESIFRRKGRLAIGYKAQKVNIAVPNEFERVLIAYICK